MRFIVYKATNKINGHFYVGLTKVGLEERRIRHMKDSGRNRKDKDCPAFYGAIRKYGIDTFEWEEIASFETIQEMYKGEERLIADLNPHYNIAVGGLVFTSKEKHREYIEKHAEKCKKSVVCLNDGKMYSSAKEASLAYGLHPKVCADLCRREGISRTGYTFVYSSQLIEDNERLTELSRRQKHKAKEELKRVTKLSHENGRKVICNRTHITYKNSLEAERQNNLKRGTVHYLCTSGKINGKGFSFSFLDEWCPNPL